MDSSRGKRRGNASDPAIRRKASYRYRLYPRVIKFSRPCRSVLT